MFYIIVGIIVIGIIGFIIGKIKEGIDVLSDAVGSMTLIITAILCVVAFLAFSWIGVLVVAAVGLGLSFILKNSKEALEDHDKRKKETALINRKTTEIDIRHKNQMALQEELNKNCKWLGEVNADTWRTILPNYVNKEYETSFESITENFAKQIEEGFILQNEDWFNVYLQFIAKKNKGYSVDQLLSFVNCPQMQMTHVTSTKKMLGEKLEEKCKRAASGEPPLLKKEAGETYWPTEYASKKLGLLETTASTPATTVIELDSI